MICSECGTKTRINWGSPSIVLCEKHSNLVNNADAIIIPLNITPKAKPNLWLGVMIYLIAIVLFAFSPLIIPGILIGLGEQLGINSLNKHDLAGWGWAIFITFPLSLIGLIAGVIFFIAQFRQVEKEFPSLKCSICGKLTSINWGSTKLISCEECMHLANESNNN